VTALSLIVTHDTSVPSLLTVPTAARACLVFAHGAGAGMNHPSMTQLCDGLASRGLATLRYQFPYMDKGSRRPDPPTLCHKTVRSAVAAARELLPAIPLFAGGKSFGGRMTSQAQALAPLPDVCGLCFWGFPLHAPKRPATTRADHLTSINIPMLFLQGTRDALAELPLVQSVVARLIAPVTLRVVDHADHSFHVLVRSGSTDGEVMQSMLDEVSRWIATVLSTRAIGGSVSSLD